MTTAAAATHYLARHLHEVEGRGWTTYNPHAKPIEELPIIYGFNNGGSPGWYVAILLAEDGTVLGSHLCSHEAYMPHDLGILEGSRPDRHKTFRTHYPDGYCMVFIPHKDALTHSGLQAAYQKNLTRAREAEIEKALKP